MSPIFLKLLPLNLSISLLYLSQFLRRWSSTLLPIQSSLAKSIQQSESTAPWGRTTRSVCTPQLLSLCLFLFFPQWHTHTHTLCLHCIYSTWLKSSLRALIQLVKSQTQIQTYRHMNVAVILSPLSYEMILSLLFPYGLVEFPVMLQQFAPILCSLRISALIWKTPFQRGCLHSAVTESF